MSIMHESHDLKGSYVERAHEIYEAVSSLALDLDDENFTEDDGLNVAFVHRALKKLAVMESESEKILYFLNEA